MSQAIRARIGICRLLLQKGTHGRVMHRENSATQRQALIDDIASGTVTREESPALLQACQEIQWACCFDRTAVLDALNRATAKKSRRALQNYMALVDFLLRIEWQDLHAEASSLHTRCSLIFSKVIKLGGRCLCEHSFKRITSIILLTSESRDRLLVMSPGQKHDLNNWVKAEFKKLTRAAAAPAVYLDSLPAGFAELPAQLRHDSTAGYSAEEPLRCPLDFLEKVIQLENSFKCRGLGSAAEAGSVQLATQPQVLMGTSGGGQLERVAGAIIAGLGQMHENQQRLMQTFQFQNPSLLPSPLQSQLQLQSPLQSQHQLQSPLRSQLQLQSPLQRSIQLQSPLQSQQQQSPLRRSIQLQSLLQCQQQQSPLQLQSQLHVQSSLQRASSSSLPATEQEPKEQAEDAEEQEEQEEAAEEEQEPAEAEKEQEPAEDESGAGVPKLLALLDERDAARRVARAKSKAKPKKNC